MSITQDGNHCFTASFEVVDVAIWSYLRRHEHYPSTFSRQVKQEGAFVIYHLFPGEAQDARKGYLGALELQKTLEGAVIEYAAPVAPEREQTEAEYEAEREAFFAAVTRHKPDNFNIHDVEQRTELEQAIARDVKYQAVKLPIMAQINAEALERLRQYELMRSEILEGLQAFLAGRGILPAGEAGAVGHQKPQSDHYAYPERDKRRAIVEHYQRDKARGVVKNKDAWAATNYTISGRTLLNYEREFEAET